MSDNKNADNICPVVTQQALDNRENNFENVGAVVGAGSAVGGMAVAVAVTGGGAAPVVGSSFAYITAAGYVVGSTIGGLVASATQKRYKEEKYKDCLVAAADGLDGNELEQLLSGKLTSPVSHFKASPSGEKESAKSR